MILYLGSWEENSIKEETTLEYVLSEYQESEITSYQERKDKIKNGLIRVTQGFVEIGHELKQIRDKELYKVDGYESITAFAKGEYNLEQWDTSRFIAINDKFSDGSSPRLLEQYEGYKYGILTEMLSLSDDEIKYVTLQTTRAEIREIKEAKKEAKSDTHAPAHVSESIENTQSESAFEDNKILIIPEAEKLLVETFRDKKNRGILKELAEVLAQPWNNEIIPKAAEVINPSGHLMVRKGALMLIFGEKSINYDNFRGDKREFTYGDFINDLVLVFDMTQQDPWVAYYGEPEPEPVPDPPKPQTSSKPEPKKEKKSEIKPTVTKSKPAMDTHQEEENPEENIPGQAYIDDYPEIKPEDISEEKESDTETSVVVTEEEIEAEYKESVSEVDENEAVNNETVTKTVETVEADIIERASKIIKIHNHGNPVLYDNNNMEISFSKETRELTIIIKNNEDRTIKGIKAIDSFTLNTWEVEIN